jgi:CCR4-NOT transcription complex subunit 1
MFSRQQISVPEQVITTIVQDNIDVACLAIEKAAMERALTDVDESLAVSFEARRRYRDVRVSLHMGPDCRR